MSERWRKVIRRLLMVSADLAEPLWGTAFWLAGLVGRKPIPILEPDGGRLVLILAPHPDDEVAGCAGTIRLHEKAGDTIWVYMVTDGRRAASPLTPDELAEQRRQEAGCVMAALQVDALEWAGYEEGSEWVSPLVEKLTAAVEALRPDIIYSPSRLDFHPDHHRTAFGLAQALKGSELAPTVRVYQVHVPLTAVLTNLIADVSGEETAIRAAVACYASQWWHLGRTLRMRRYTARYFGSGRSCEPFWQMTAEAFCELHEETADFDRDGRHWSLTDYTGTRFFSWRDPLAYLKGRSHRRELLEQAATYTGKFLPKPGKSLGENREVG